MVLALHCMCRTAQSPPSPESWRDSGALLSLDWLRRQVGGGGPARFVDVSNDRSLRSLGFSNTAPAWRTACRGLNVEGICVKSSCLAYNQTVIHMVGYDTWSLTHSACACPTCKTQFQPVTCGFYDCACALPRFALLSFCVSCQSSACACPSSAAGAAKAAAHLSLYVLGVTSACCAVLFDGRKALPGNKIKDVSPDWKVCGR